MTFFWIIVVLEALVGSLLLFLSFRHLHHVFTEDNNRVDLIGVSAVELLIGMMLLITAVVSWGVAS